MTPKEPATYHSPGNHVCHGQKASSPAPGTQQPLGIQMSKVNANLHLRPLEGGTISPTDSKGFYWAFGFRAEKQFVEYLINTCSVFTWKNII